MSIDIVTSFLMWGPHPRDDYLYMKYDIKYHINNTTHNLQKTY